MTTGYCGIARTDTFQQIVVDWSGEGAERGKGEFMLVVRALARVDKGMGRPRGGW